MRLFVPLLLISLAAPSFFQGTTSAQNDDTVATNVRVDFSLVYNTRRLAYDTWDQENIPDIVRLDALKVASGYLAGIPFHYERNRDRINVHEQVEVVANDLVYSGYRDPSRDYCYFDFVVWVPSDYIHAARDSQEYQGHGVSELEDIALAREDARTDAFKNSIIAAIQDEYTNRNEEVPGIVDGRITWYETDRDEIDPESGSYIYDITAWVSFSDEEEAE